MPLNTQIIRNGETVPLHWGDFHVAAMALAANFEMTVPALGNPSEIYETDELTPQMFDCYPDAAFPITRSIAFQLTTYGALAATPLNDGNYVLQRKHKFLDLVDGEVLELLPGDELIAYRN